VLEMPELENLLLNITNRDHIYNIVNRIIISLLPEDLKKEALKSERMKILSTDVFFLHYSSHPILKDFNKDELLESARIVISRYVESKDFMKARISTELDEQTSMIFSVAFLKNLLKSLTTSTTESKQKNEELEGEGKGKESVGTESGKEEGERKTGTTDNLQELNEKHDKEMTAQARQEKKEGMDKAILEALSQASLYATRAKQLKDIGFSGGASREKGDVKKLLNLTEVIMEVKEAQEIMDLLRKMNETIPKTIHTEKIYNLYGEEVRGYRRTKKFERAIPREFALPKEIFFSKYSSEGLLTIEKKESKKGIFYLLLDKSGSMSGHKLVWSRSVALFFLRLAMQKEMEVQMRMFDSEPYPYATPMRSISEMIESVITVASNGGTDIKKALSVAIDDLGKVKKKKETFILLITDGEDRFSMQKDSSWKNVRLITIMVSGDNEVLKNLSDLYLKAGLTVDGALSIAREGERLLLTGEKSKYKHA
jgi:uncharacterized protein with von Willebrand factor type A (vWA) domain